MEASYFLVGMRFPFFGWGILASQFLVLLPLSWGLVGKVTKGVWTVLALGLVSALLDPPFPLNLLLGVFLFVGGLVICVFSSKRIPVQRRIVLMPVLFLPFTAVLPSTLLLSPFGKRDVFLDAKYVHFHDSIHSQTMERRGLHVYREQTPFGAAWTFKQGSHSYMLFEGDVFFGEGGFVGSREIAERIKRWASPNETAPKSTRLTHLETNQR